MDDDDEARCKPVDRFEDEEGCCEEGPETEPDSRVLKMDMGFHLGALWD